MLNKEQLQNFETLTDAQMKDVSGGALWAGPLIWFGQQIWQYHDDMSKGLNQGLKGKPFKW